MKYRKIKERLEKLYEVIEGEKKSFKEIAKLYGCSHSECQKKVCTCKKAS